MPLILVCYINAYAQTNIENANRHQEMMNIILQKPKKFENNKFRKRKFGTHVVEQINFEKVSKIENCEKQVF